MNETGDGWTVVDLGGWPLEEVEQLLKAAAVANSAARAVGMNGEVVRIALDRIVRIAREEGCAVGADPRAILDGLASYKPKLLALIAAVATDNLEDEVDADERLIGAAVLDLISLATFRAERDPDRESWAQSLTAYNERFADANLEACFGGD